MFLSATSTLPPMKKVLFTLCCIGIAVFGLTATSHGKTVVFFVGGWGMTPAEMASFSRSVPEAKKVTFLLPTVISELVRPWHCSDLVYDQMVKTNVAGDDLIIVSYSFGGTVTQWLLKSHPELRVKKLILVGAPIGGYKFVPPNNFFSSRFPKDLPIYVIAGSKGQDVWFLRDENDGVVDLDSAFAIPDQNLKDAAIVHAEHSDLPNIAEVQTHLAQWLDLEQEPAQYVVAGNRLHTLPDSSLPFTTAVTSTSQ
jgi:pimeloyl-ACP methyl ester carboxylesterase